MTSKTPVTGFYRSAVVVLIAATALPVAACGSSKHTATADSDLVSAANAICAKAVAKHDGHPFPCRISTRCTPAPETCPP